MAGSIAPAVIMALGSLFSSGMQVAGSAASSKKGYHYSSNLLNRQQNFAERLANTAHQREVDDLVKAGINPLYTATGGGGASTPTPSAGTVSAYNPDVGNIFLNGMSQFANIRNQTNATNADVALKGAQTQDVIGGMQERLVRMQNMLEERNLTKAKRHQIYAAIDETRANIKQLNSLTDFNIANAKYTNDRSRGYSNDVRLPFGIGFSRSGNSLNPYGKDKGQWVTEYTHDGRPYNVFQYY